MDGTVVVIAATVASTSLCALGLWFLAYRDRRLRVRGYLFMAAGAAVQTIACMVGHSPVLAAINAAMAAWFLYAWWNGGGGDGMKRRLKKWTAALGRQTAPQGA